MKAARYIRVSTEDQAKEGYSLETQNERLGAFCQAQGWDTFGETYKDDSTGMDTEREGYQSMLRDVAKWDVVVAVKGDRFHRNVDNARAFWKQMRQAGKQVWTIAEGRLDTAKNASQWLASMMTTALLPEFESMQISERVLPGMAKAKEKNLHVGRVPLGFVWVKKEARFIMSTWAEKFYAIYTGFGGGSVEEARKRTPIEDGKRKGQLLTRSAAYRLVDNIRKFKAGTLLPNRKRTTSGTWSKFKD